MKRDYYSSLADQGLTEEKLTSSTCQEILNSPDVELFPLLNAAFEVRKKFTGKSVTVHIINNAQNGHCPEDCHYCAQAKTSETGIKEYPLKSDQEIIAEAKSAYEKGAFRYCMVFAGRGPSDRRVDHLCNLIKEIKSQYPIEICVSAGLLNQDKADRLKEAGLDRLNHNLNTSEAHYPNICTTHTYLDRLNTLKAARKAGIQLCSGLIVGMKESSQDIIDVAYKLREMKAESIPVNLFMPIEGTNIKETELTPDYCLRVLCLFRFLNPKAEIRVAAGREFHLRNLEVLALYPANSLFLDGYLNTKGAEAQKTLQMIKDAGFTIQSRFNIDEVMNQYPLRSTSSQKVDTSYQLFMKDIKDLRPNLEAAPKK
jgi:biotin synthase